MSPFDIQEREQFVVLETVKLKHPSFCRGEGGTDGGYTSHHIEKKKECLTAPQRCTGLEGQSQAVGAEVSLLSSPGSVQQLQVTC